MTLIAKSLLGLFGFVGGSFAVSKMPIFSSDSKSSGDSLSGASSHNTNGQSTEDESQKLGFADLLSKINGCCTENNSQDSALKRQFQEILQSEQYEIENQDLESCKEAKHQSENFCFLELKSDNKQYKLQLSYSDDSNNKKLKIIFVKKESDNKTYEYCQNKGSESNVQYDNLTTYKDEHKRTYGNQLCKNIQNR